MVQSGRVVRLTVGKEYRLVDADRRVAHNKGLSIDIKIWYAVVGISANNCHTSDLHLLQVSANGSSGLPSPAPSHAGLAVDFASSSSGCTLSLLSPNPPFRRLTQQPLRLLYPSLILLLQPINLLLCRGLLDRLLHLHDLHQRGLVRQVPVGIIILGRNVHAVIVLQQIPRAQQRVRQRLVRRVQQGRQCQRLLMRRRTGRVLVRMVLGLELEELALQRRQGDVEGAGRRWAGGDGAWEECVVVRYVGEGTGGFLFS